MEGAIRILILEDEAADFELIERELRKAGFAFATHWAQDRKAFLAALEQFQPDLLLADYSLPGFDGLTALKLSKERFPEIPGIIVSGAIGEEIAIEALKAGATDYVLKHRLNRLGPVVRRALQEGEQVRQRRRAEQARRESEERLRLLIEAVKDYAIIMLDPQGRVVTWNPGAQRVKGYTAEEIVGENFSRFYLPEDVAVGKPQRHLTLAAEHGQCADEGWRPRRDGSRFWASVTITAIHDDAGQLRGFAKITGDMTERKLAEEELTAARVSAEKAKAVAELANRAKDHFLAVLSHELRTPLTPVVMGLSMLAAKAGLSRDVRDLLEIIRRNIDMEARLIDDLLDITRISQGKTQLNRGPVELCTIIQRAVEVCNPDIAARRLDFGVDFGPAALYWVDADAPRLQQVFWNLLKNAIKFTPEGGCVGIRCRNDDQSIAQQAGAASGLNPEPESPNPEPRTLNPEPRALNPEPRTLNPSVVVEVNDSGIGIEPDALARIFNAFEQAERSIARQFGGLGLGLAISKALVEMHGGTISASSPGRDKGATFCIRLPLCMPAGQPQTSPAAPPRAVRPLRILLVEDHGATAKMMGLALSLHGHTIETAGDLRSALELAEHQAFDLLISDLGLPDGSGHELMRALRARGYTLPGIALSGYGQEEDIQRSHEAGFATHLTKPASHETLIEAIAAVME